jgi:hypothetical protein
VEALSTGDTIFFSKGLHVRRKTMLCHLKDIRPRHIHASLDAAQTHDTSIKPLPDQRGSIGDGGELSLFWRILVLFDPEFIGTVLELTFSSSIADRAVQRMVDQQ